MYQDPIPHLESAGLAHQRPRVFLPVLSEVTEVVRSHLVGHSNNLVRAEPGNGNLGNSVLELQIKRLANLSKCAASSAMSVLKSRSVSRTMSLESPSNSSW